jgi:type II secretory pathway pseudopilin PulG
MRRSATGFTLLEICLAIAIGALLLLVAVPSVAGMLAQQRLQRSFDRFDRLVSSAATRSVTEQRAYALTWEEHGVRLVPLEPPQPGQPAADPEKTTDFLGMGKPDEILLQLPATLSRRPLGQWTFWSNGTCEPATIAYHGADGSWVVRYNPLTAHGVFLSSNVP